MQDLREPLIHTSAVPLRQRGLTLVEFMVAIALGLILVAGMATLIASQSNTRAVIDTSGAMIENGRYALSVLESDLQLAGYWGDVSTLPTAPATLPDPCDTSLAGLQAAIPVHVQGYSGLATLPAVSPNLASCLPGWVAGTDILVVRHLDTTEVATSATVTGGYVYMQTGLDAAGTALSYVVSALNATGVPGTGTFNLRKKDGSPASLRKYLTNIYYIRNLAADGTTALPSLWVSALSGDGTATVMTQTAIAENIENLQVDYAVDTDGDGAPNGAPVDGTALIPVETVANKSAWPNVMGVTVSLLARTARTVSGYTDSKSYQLGATATATPAANDGYQRHVFAQTVRLVNPSSRRM
ncbi:PilW family protein [Curvibacter sp. APW13]|uniref:PilW family protein n=1 Tax=Curvibacter sp. APW13 TaxID=3077236 RepID=UPI0028DE9A3B|nr:PilW family protein [Curvibacter sp. APW13]MDT8990647.1 PilW family protein [Curvibacter sp. APW13]